MHFILKLQKSLYPAFKRRRPPQPRLLAKHEKAVNPCHSVAHTDRRSRPRRCGLIHVVHAWSKTSHGSSVTRRLSAAEAENAGPWSTAIVTLCTVTMRTALFAGLRLEFSAYFQHYFLRQLTIFQLTECVHAGLSAIACMTVITPLWSALQSRRKCNRKLFIS